jgi:hypothetical protein
LNKSKASARNSIFIRSVIFVVLASERSTFLKLGPGNEFLRMFSKWKTPAAVAGMPNWAPAGSYGWREGRTLTGKTLSTFKSLKPT